MRRYSKGWIRIICVVALLSPTAGCEAITSVLKTVTPPPLMQVSFGVGSLIGIFVASNAPIEASVEKSCLLNGEVIDCSDVPDSASQSARSSLAR